MKVYAGTGRKPHRGGERNALPPQKTPQRETSRNPEQRLRQQQPRAAGCAANVCTGRGGAGKRHREEEEEGKGGWSSQTKSPSRLPGSRRSPIREAASNELTATRAKRTTTSDVTGRPPGSPSARRSTPSTHQRARSCCEPRRLPCPQPLTNDRQGSPLPPQQTPSLGRPRASPPAPVPSRRGWGLDCVSLTPQCPGPRQPFQGAPGQPGHKTAAALQPNPRRALEEREQRLEDRSAASHPGPRRPAPAAGPPSAGARRSLRAQILPPTPRPSRAAASGLWEKKTAA